MGYIYLIRNTINGKGYVGQTVVSIEQRFSEHVAASNIRSCSEETKVKIGNANRGRYKGVPWNQARRDAQIRRAS